MKKKRLTRRFLSSIFLFSTAILTMNAEQLVVEEKTGGITSYDLGDLPVITFENNSLVVKTDIASAEFNLAYVDKYYFKSNNTTLVSDLPNAYSLVSVVGDEVRLSGFSAHSQVYLYAMSGQLLGIYDTMEDGSLTISLATRTNGVYIVKTNSTTVKITKK